MAEPMLSLRADNLRNRDEVWLVHHHSDYYSHGSSAISYSSMTFLGFTSFLAYGLEYTT